MKLSALLVLAGLVAAYGQEGNDTTDQIDINNSDNTTVDDVGDGDDNDEVLLSAGGPGDNYGDSRRGGYVDYRSGDYGNYRGANYGYDYQPRKPPVYHYPQPEYPDFIEPTDPGKEVPYPFIDIPTEVEGHEEILPPISGYNCFLSEAPYSTCGRRSIQAYFLEQCVGLYYLLSENVNGICGGHRERPEPEPEELGYGPVSEQYNYYQGNNYGDNYGKNYGDRDEREYRRDYDRVLMEETSADYSQPKNDDRQYNAPNYGPSNYGSSNYGPSNYGPSNYGPSNYGPSNYGQPKYNSRENDQSNYGPSKYGDAKYGPPKNNDPKYGASGYDAPKYGSPKYEQPPNYGPSKYEQPQYRSPKYAPNYDPKYAQAKPTPAPTGYGATDAVAEYQKEKCLQKSYISITTAVVMCLTENFIRVKFIEHYACYAKQNPIEGPILYLRKLHTFIRNVIKCSEGKKAIENYPNLWITFRNDEGKVAYNPNAPYVLEKTDNRIGLPYCANGEAAGLSRFTVGGPGKYFLCSNPEYIKDTNPYRGYYAQDVSNIHYDIAVIESCTAASKTYLGVDSYGHSLVLKSCQYYGRDHGIENDDIHTPNRQALSDQSLQSLYNSVSFVQKSTSVLTRPLTIAEIATRISGPVGQPLLEGFGILYYCAFHACKANTHNDVDGNCFPKFEDCDTEWHVPSGVTTWDAIKESSQHIKQCLAYGRLTNKGIAENPQVVEYNAALRRSYICLAETEVIDFLQNTWNVKPESLTNDALGLVYLRHIAVEKCHADVKDCKSNVELYSLLIKALNSLETDCKNYRPSRQNHRPEPRNIEFPKPVADDDDNGSEPEPERRPTSEGYAPQSEQRSPYGDRQYGDRQYGDRQYGDRQYGDRQYGERRDYGPGQYSDRQYGAPKYEASKYGPSQYEAPKYAPLQYDTPKYAPYQYDAPKYAPSQYEAPRPGGEPNPASQYYPRELLDGSSNGTTITDGDVSADTKDGNGPDDITVDDDGHDADDADDGHDADDADDGNAGDDVSN